MKHIKSIIILIPIFVFMFVAYFVSTVFFEPKVSNFMVRNFTANKIGSPEIVLITIDDKSLERERWPWKRDMYAKLFSYLNDYTESKVVGFDAVISTPDRYNPQSDRIFYDAINKFDNLVVGAMFLKSPYPNIQAGKAYDAAFTQKFSTDILDNRAQKYTNLYHSLSRYPKPYFGAVSKVGSINVTNDSDGFVRTVDQIIDYNGVLYPSLALKIYSFLNGNPQIIVGDNSILVKGKDLRIKTFQSYGGVFNFLHFYKTLPNTDYSHKKYSAIDVIDSYDNLKKGKQPLIHPSEFEDKIVLVGANAKAAGLGMEDARQTPLQNKHPGIDIQATNLDNLINNDLITSTNSWQEILVSLAIIIATFFAIRFMSLFLSLGFAVMLMVSYILVCVVCFRLNVYIYVVTPIVFQIITMIFGYLYKFILENRNKEKIKQAMGKYISQDIMQDVVKNIDKVKLGGKKADLTVLFADIRGFTSLSEKLSAQEVSVILNEYFTEIEPIITRYNGVINKFIGDAVMAIFGEPILDKNHAENAVKCANAMLKKVEQLQEKWLLEGKPKIEIGVGINTGGAFVGNIGSEKRMEYTVIGDMVNLASRIESYNKVYKTNFLVSESTYIAVRNIVDVIKISEVSIRGKAKKMNIYEVLRVV